MDLYDIAKYGIIYICLPLIVYFYKRIDNKVEEVDKRLSIQEAKHGIMEERVENLRQDILEIKAMLRELLNRNN